MTNRSLVVCNWKSYFSLVDVENFLEGHARSLLSLPYEWVICPSFPFLSYVRDYCWSHPGCYLGAQDVSAYPVGAYTGDVSVTVLNDMGCRYVLVGHSERRAYYKESDNQIVSKCQLLYAKGVTPIICVGETQEARHKGTYLSVIQAQLSFFLPYLSSAPTYIAYEPLWAIGQNHMPTYDEIEEVHRYIRAFISSSLSERHNVGILYGGGLSEWTARSVLQLPHVDGLLLGRLSLSVSRLLNSLGE